MRFDYQKLKFLRAQLAYQTGQTFTQTWVAYKLNIPYGTYRNWEQGVRTPTAIGIQKLCAFFQCDSADFEHVKKWLNQEVKS